ncbi:MAG: hypothetical protein N2053_04820 [Chitinispirillaceae bacterium]|nr:hypothetical protein [Chitinispirillaceae bacterium]
MKKIVLFTFVFLCELNAKEFLKTNLIITSVGSWVVFSENSRRSYFNKISTTSYGRIWIFKTVVSIPLYLTVHTRPDEIKSRFAPGDFDFTLSYPVYEGIEPIVGMLIPMGYGINSDWKKMAWIGSNNIRLEGGVSLNRSFLMRLGIPLSLEGAIAVAITDENAHYTKGSLTGYLYIKNTKIASKNTSLTIETSLYGKSVRWKWNHRKENSLTLLPSISLCQKVGKKIYFGMKCGAGPSFLINKTIPYYKSTAADIGVSLQFYP